MRNNILKYLILSVSIIIFNKISYSVLNVNGLINAILIEKLTPNQIEDFFNFQNKWEFIRYLLVVLGVFLKTILITSVLYIGVFIFNKSTATFKELWGIVLKSEFIFLLVPICKIIWFYFFQTEYKLIDIQYFYPLSALNIISYKGLEPWLIYPLQTLNLFELAYIVYLSYQIGNLTKTNADSGLKIVASSYIPSLFLWVTIVMFFTLNFS